MFSGFYGLNRAYIDEDRGASPFLLAFYMFLTGVGSCAGTISHFYCPTHLPCKVSMPPSMLQQRISLPREVLARFLLRLMVTGTATAFPVSPCVMILTVLTQL